MQLFYSDHFELPLPDGHRFPMSKYRLLRQRIVASVEHEDDHFVVPPAATVEQLVCAHDADYVERVIAGELTAGEIKRIGFPWSKKMVERSCRSSGATLAGARAALTEGLAVNLAGGTHHAMKAAGEGYCVFNDAAVAICNLHKERLIQRAAVVDCDVHQGNGTADILGQTEIAFTFSIHGARNFPLRRCKSHLDIDLPDATKDTEYLEALRHSLQIVVRNGPYDLVVYLAGADPFVDDRLGRLSLSKDGLLQRDELVLSTFRELKIPIVIAMAGGYAPNVADIVDIHANTIRVAKRFWAEQNRGGSMASR